MITATAIRSARYAFPDLCHTEALWQIVADAGVGIPYGDDRVWLTWKAQLDPAIEALRGEERKVVHILCSRCSGTGMTRYMHRHGGICYACEGYGCKKRFRQALIEGTLREAATPSR